MRTEKLTIEDVTIEEVKSNNPSMYERMFVVTFEDGDTDKIGLHGAITGKWMQDNFGVSGSPENVDVFNAFFE